MKPIARAAATLTAAAVSILTTTGVATANPGPAPVGEVYVQTNDPAGNVVRVYDRLRDGSLRAAGSYATGGLGGALAGAVVDRLASQGSVLLDAPSHLLYVVNAGSDSLTVFGVHGSRLERLEVVPTGGDFPVSVTAHDHRLAVLNARGGGSVQGFARFGSRLVPVAAWHRDLGLDPAATPEFTHTPGQVQFTPDGRALLVTTKAGSNAIDVFRWGPGGLAHAPVVTSLPGAVPFAIAFDPRGHAVVAEASNVVATFAVERSGALRQLDAQPTGQAATCWIAADGRHVFLSNAGSATVSTYRVGASGALQAGAVTATHPGTVDAAVSGDGRYLYVETGAQGVVDAFRVGPHGALTPVGSTTVPGAAGGEGIAAS